MATIVAQAITEAGDNNVTYATCEAEGDAFANDGDQIAHFKNGGVGALTVTIVAETTSVDSTRYGTLTKANKAISVPSEGEAFIGTFPQSSFNDGDGLVQMTYSGVTSLTVAILTVKHSQ